MRRSEELTLACQMLEDTLSHSVIATRLLDAFLGVLRKHNVHLPIIRGTKAASSPQGNSASSLHDGNNSQSEMPAIKGQ